MVTHWGTLHSLDGNRKENTAGLSLHPLLLVAVVQRSLVVPKGKVQLSLHGPFRMVTSENIQDSPGGKGGGVRAGCRHPFVHLEGTELPSTGKERGQQRGWQKIEAPSGEPLNSYSVKEDTSGVC